MDSGLANVARTGHIVHVKPVPLYFDIETGPLPENECLTFLRPLSEEDIAVGDIRDKDPEVRAQRIAERQAEKNAEHRRKFLDAAALSAITGRVVAIGFRVGQRAVDILGCTQTPESGPLAGGGVFEGLTTESEVLRRFWAIAAARDRVLIGWNSAGFDLPFLFRKSWANGVVPPDDLLHGLWWNPGRTLDLMQVWQCGDRRARAKLDDVARHLGYRGKTGDHGKRFSELWVSNRAVAFEYLEQDVNLCASIHGRISPPLGGYLPPPAADIMVDGDGEDPL